MTEEQAKRKLTAILSADVKGYSHLMADDEEATVVTINAYREVMTGLIKDQRGRVVDAKGDNVLAEFPSVVDAVRCAVQVQNDLKERNSELPEHRKMEFRIGINLGDVIEAQGTIYGDGVNVAARLEGLAEGGGICISGTAFDQVKNRISVGYKYQGKQSVKNIPDPVRVYKVLLEPEATGKVIGEEEPRPRKKRWAAIAAVAVLAVVAGGLFWNFYVRPDVEPASVDKMAYPLPDKPSIAVLPFANLSGDPGQDFLVDGITENIITVLSGVPQLFVIARNSTFAYKEKSVKVQQVAEDLGVRYVLEGSVARSGDRIRVTVQLIDALKGHHLWAERYDRELKDIFAVQDDLTINILRGMQLKLTQGEGILHLGIPKNFEVYLKLMKGLEYLRGFNIDDNNRARLIVEECIALEPDYGSSYGLLAAVHMMDYYLGSTKNPAQSLNQAIEYSQKALDLSKDKGRKLAILGNLYAMKRDYGKAIELGEQAIAMVPNGADAHAWLAMSLTFAGRAQEALPLFEKAMRLNPLPPAFYYLNFGSAYRLLGRFEEAVTMYKKTIALTPNNIFAYEKLAATYGLMGKEEEAKAAAAEVLRINPKFSIDYYAKTSVFKDKERLIEALRKAGIPEHPPLPLPDKPSIAVLPFTNMSGDPEQEYFSDGITEEIITALSKTPKLFVIARNSTFTYKGKPVRVQQVGRELGVKYVLAGSVRKAGDKVRITAQLVDSQTGYHLWAERYDRELKDVFALQDEITMRVITALQVKLTEGERADIWAKSTDNLEAYLKFLEAVGYTYETKWRAETRALIEEAIALDPQFSAAYGRLAYTYLMDVFYGPSESRPESFKKGFESARKCVALDDSQAFGHAMMGQFYLMNRQYDEAIAEGRKALELGPNDSWVNLWQGMTLRSVGRHEEAVSILQHAIRLDPLNTKWPLFHLGSAYLLMRRYEDAIETYQKALKLYPEMFNAYIGLAVAYSSLERMDEARSAASELLKLYPSFSVVNFGKTLPYKNEADKEFFITGLRKSGLPD